MHLANTPKMITLVISAPTYQLQVLGPKPSITAHVELQGPPHVAALSNGVTATYPVPVSYSWVACHLDTSATITAATLWATDPRIKDCTISGIAVPLPTSPTPTTTISDELEITVNSTVISTTFVSGSGVIKPSISCNTVVPTTVL